MTSRKLKLDLPPIVEAVLDIDCDLPADTDFGALEVSAQKQFQDAYPKLGKRFGHEVLFEGKPGESTQLSAKQGLVAVVLSSSDGKQLVQLRPQGYSFNRLAPYEGLDAYKPEIKRTWDLFMQLARPLQVRTIRLRFINRILLPTKKGHDLEKFLKLGPRLPEKDGLVLSGFLSQHSAVEPTSGNAVNITMATQPPSPDEDKLPVILDIEAYFTGNMEPSDWKRIEGRIASLRTLKNKAFEKSLTPRCLNLFRR